MRWFFALAGTVAVVAMLYKITVWLPHDFSAGIDAEKYDLRVSRFACMDNIQACIEAHYPDVPVWVFIGHRNESVHVSILDDDLADDLTPVLAHVEKMASDILASRSWLVEN